MAERSGVAAWLRRSWRALLAETCATALLVGLGVASSLHAPGAAEPPLANVACAFGFVVVGCCVAFGGASGAHMNPAVSLCAALGGRLAPALCVAYVLAQLAGAVLGFAALQGALGAAPPAGLTRPAPHVSGGAAAALEAVLTGLLALACCAAWEAHDPARPDPAVPIKLGLLVAGLVYAGVSVCAGDGTGREEGASLTPRLRVAGPRVGRQLEPGAQLRAGAAAQPLGAALGE